MWKTLKIEKDKDQGQDKKIWKRDQRKNKIKNKDQKNKLNSDFFNFLLNLYSLFHMYLLWKLNLHPIKIIRHLN